MATPYCLIIKWLF